MRLATLSLTDGPRVAIIADRRALLLPASVGGVATLAMNRDRLETITPEDDVDVATATFLPPVPRPGKILCVGVNYRDHASEAAISTGASTYPSLFVRFPSSLVGHRQPVVAPAISEQFDFEGELGVIIGRAAWRVRAEEALTFVAGYCCFAENSVRDFQAHARQITPGKNFLASGAFGPWLATPDEVGDPSALELVTRLNGTVMQQASTGGMIFQVPELIAYISQFTRLEPGDVIATGTPAGVGSLRNPPVWMKPGDVLEVTIDRVGTLRNPVIAEVH